MTKLLYASLWLLAALMALVLLVFGIRRLAPSRRTGPAALFASMVAIALALLAPGPSHHPAASEFRHTSAALFSMLNLAQPAWVQLPEWKAVLSLWKDLDEHARGGRGQTTVEEMQAFRERAKAVAADLDKAAASGKLSAQTAAAARNIIDQQVWHVNRMMSTCYRAVSLDHRRVENVTRRVELLKQLHDGGKVDDWLYERAMADMVNEISGQAAGDDKVQKEFTRLKGEAVAEALQVQRLFDEHRLATLADAAAWKELKKQFAPLLESKGIEEWKDKETLDKMILPLVNPTGLGSVPAAALSALLLDLSRHNFRMGPNAPTCYDMSMEGERRLQNRSKLVAILAEVRKAPVVDEKTWKDRFDRFTPLVFALYYKPGKLADSETAPAFLLDAAHLFDLMCDLARP